MGQTERGTDREGGKTKGGQTRRGTGGGHSLPFVSGGFIHHSSAVVGGGVISVCGCLLSAGTHVHEWEGGGGHLLP
jgi:hypothetical protein